jgi:hypothetical protein
MGSWALDQFEILYRYSTSGGLCRYCQRIKCTLRLFACLNRQTKKWRTEVRHKLPRKNVRDLIKRHITTHFFDSSTA